MTPMTPLIDTPNGRLAELISLLTDAPLHISFDAVTRSDAAAPAQRDDPWWLVASSVVRIRTAVTAEELTSSLLPADISPQDFVDHNRDEEVLSEVLTGLIDLAAV